MGNKKEDQRDQRRLSKVFQMKPRPRRSDNLVAPAKASITTASSSPLIASPNELAPITAKTPKTEELVESTRITITSGISTELTPRSTEINDFTSGRMAHHEISPHLDESTQTPNSRDRASTAIRYEKAVKQLKDSLKRGQSNWECFDLPDFDVSQNSLFPQLGDSILRILDERKSSIEDVSFWSKCKHAIERIFTATSPFTKIFLQAVSQGQSVRHEIYTTDVTDNSPV